MAALSSLRTASENGRRMLFTLRGAGPFAVRSVPPSSSFNGAVIRSMSGHGRKIEFIPTSFEWRKFKDHIHFYFLLGTLPIAGIIGASNLFIGQHELADIPEGYEPKHWEYYKSPISRFIARYLIDSPEKWYERHMHFVALEKDKILMRKLEKKVELLVGEAGQRYDSKRWYYIPVNDRAAPAKRQLDKDIDELEGYK